MGGWRVYGSVILETLATMSFAGAIAMVLMTLACWGLSAQALGVFFLEWFLVVGVASLFAGWIVSGTNRRSMTWTVLKASVPIGGVLAVLAVLRIWLDNGRAVPARLVVVAVVGAALAIPGVLYVLRQRRRPPPADTC